MAPEWWCADYAVEAQTLAGGGSQPNQVIPSIANPVEVYGANNNAFFNVVWGPEMLYSATQTINGVTQTLSAGSPNANGHWWVTLQG